MDVLTGLLDGPKARGAFLLKSVFDPPWSLRIEDRAPISLATMVRGSAWVMPDGGVPALIGPGDIAVLRGPDPYTIADAQDTPVQITVGPDQRCSTTVGEDVTDTMALGVRTWGDPLGQGSSVMLSGTYQAPGEIGRRLLGALPTLLVLPAALDDTPLVPLLAEEIGRDEPGQELVLDRLLDLLFVGVLRAWLAEPDAGAPAWYHARSDPRVGPALRLLHGDPAHAWTVESLARKVGVSRAGLARRFTEVVGEPPMTYLATLRLALAADLLLESDATVATVARQVGYSSAFALSSAFKRVRGVSPQEYRKSGASRIVMPRETPSRTVVLGG
ncbi:AraC family transcriptional regulator (plasmid) [Streptomyces sp. NBC_01591]|uniref:AraC family transcriptional regulator n=1 Tax=Streptomyces sp. NBC_01591 TaxID=2975888 RepID=UPI002DDC86F3|nr:AraC family transcriptional regulator [Streptomyces sp. NBC_01591]WSD73874.1 AraC family transcriptional regulator [Streptomyces sp. NBC_01591]